MSNDLNSMHFDKVKSIQIPIPMGSSRYVDVYKIVNSNGVVIWKKNTHYDETFTHSTTITVPATQLYNIQLIGSQGGGACCYTGRNNSGRIVTYGGNPGQIITQMVLSAGTQYNFVSGSGGQNNNITYITRGGTWNGGNGGDTSFNGLQISGGTGGTACDFYSNTEAWYSSSGGTGGRIISGSGTSGLNGSKVYLSGSEPWNEQTSSSSGSLRIWSVD